LARGFWLYVWRIGKPDGQIIHYVGRTGDSSTLNAASPFSRVGGHLGSNENANQLRRHLKAHGLVPEDCASLEMVAFGPIHEEAKTKEDHTPRRDSVAALEKALCDAMKLAGYEVVNVVNSRRELNPAEWDTVRDAFAKHFPRLTTRPEAPAGRHR
jgi:hypothetical protein